MSEKRGAGVVVSRSPRSNDKFLRSRLYTARIYEDNRDNLLREESIESNRDW